MALIVVTRVAHPVIPDRLSADHDLWVWPEDSPVPPEKLAEVVAEADGLFCLLTDRVDAALLEVAPRLKAISQMAVGVDNIDLAECIVRGIPVGHTPGVLTETTADTALALMLDCLRRVTEGAEHVRAGLWGQWVPDLLVGKDLHGATVGIVGLGRIGTAVARRLRGFDCHLLYTGPRRHPEAEAELGVAYRHPDQLLAESDVVVLSTPLNDSTRNLIDADALGLMKPTALLVNISRGGLVDHAALDAALASGQIWAAALDVTDPEPLPPDHPLMARPNCLIIPHLGSASEETRLAMADLAVSNLLAGLAGERMPECANPAVYV
ncbi:MAG TPA: D-glycerate dehydrogenase [Acidimicrobiia bacterium]|jgi:lactate dehydrogenase-like 2-hydroxyacid dehydrogenase